MISIQGWRLAAYGLIALACFSTGWLVKGWKVASDAEIRLEAQHQGEELARDLIANVAKKTSEAIGGIRVTNTTIYQKTRHEITREPMDPGCRLPAGWMRLINDARAGQDRSGAAGAMP